MCIKTLHTKVIQVVQKTKMCIHYTCPTSLILTILCHQSLCFLHTLAAMTLLIHLPEISFCYGSGHKPSPNFSRFSPNHLPPLIIPPHYPMRHIRAPLLQLCRALFSYHASPTRLPDTRDLFAHLAVPQKT